MKDVTNHTKAGEALHNSALGVRVKRFYQLQTFPVIQGKTLVVRETNPFPF